MIQYRGTNLTGGDCLYTGIPATGPVDGTNYKLVGFVDVDKVLSKGANMFRLVFGWEAMQPKPYATLGASGVARCDEYFLKVMALAQYITSKGAVCVLDIHGGSDATFAAYRGVKVGGGFTEPSTGKTHSVTDMLCNLWEQIATRYKSDPLIHFGITNEPCNVPTLVWFGAAQRVIDRIRSTGATNRIWLPGNYFSGPSSWLSTSMYDTGNPKQSNGFGWDNARGPGLPIKDSAGNIGIQVHLYFDINAGGGTSDIASSDIGAKRLAAMTNWARDRGLSVLVAEVGLSANNQLAKDTWQRTIDYMSANSDVFAGWLWWAYGPPSWWGEYRFALCDHENGIPSAQMALVAPSMAAPVDETEELKHKIELLKISLASADERVRMLSANILTLNEKLDAVGTLAAQIVSTADS